ncbi:hypothetical protein [Pseudalkalibacillus sp. SCS-8]|uniref:hypothetical protein n=1 Tax=Pseudalkalibacillus nanhaiensis TaxID=3115291 RepID=UPI0032DB3203
METFGRGCLYIIIGMGVLFLIAMLAQAHITIPWFIFIPLVIVAFWVAKQKTDSKTQGEEPNNDDDD